MGLQAEVEGPLALLRVATSVNAELLGRDDLAGSVRARWRAACSSWTATRTCRPPSPEGAGSLRAVMNGQQLPGIVRV